jgi:hypothetical protein
MMSVIVSILRSWWRSLLRIYQGSWPIHFSTLFWEYLNIFNYCIYAWRQWLYCTVSWSSKKGFNQNYILSNSYLWTLFAKYWRNISAFEDIERILAVKREKISRYMRYLALWIPVCNLYTGMRILVQEWPYRQSLFCVSTLHFRFRVALPVSEFWIRWLLVPDGIPPIRYKQKTSAHDQLK